MVKEEETLYQIRRSGRICGMAIDDLDEVRVEKRMLEELYETSEFEIWVVKVTKEYSRLND